MLYAADCHFCTTALAAPGANMDDVCRCYQFFGMIHRTSYNKTKLNRYYVRIIGYLSKEKFKRPKVKVTVKGV